MALFEIKPERINRIESRPFEANGIRERSDLQRYLLEDISVIIPEDSDDEDILIIAEEFRDWDESQRSIDLLGIDMRANLVVIELKRVENAHQELQTIRYRGDDINPDI